VQFLASVKYGHDNSALRDSQSCTHDPHNKQNMTRKQSSSFIGEAAAYADHQQRNCQFFQIVNE